MARRTPPTLVTALPPIGAKEVRALRLRAGLAQAGFAECLNVSHELVQAWETGRRTPRGAALRLLALAQGNPELVFPSFGAVPPGRATTPSQGTAPLRRATPAAGIPRPVAPPSEFDALVCGLVDQGVRFVLVGGLAAQLRGVPGATDDVDIIYERSPENLERLSAFLRRETSTLRGAPGRVVFAADPRTLAHTSALALDTRLGPLDLRQRISGVGDFTAASHGASTLVVAGRPVPTLTLDSLIGARRAAGRPRDRAQIPVLEELLGRRG